MQQLWLGCSRLFMILGAHKLASQHINHCKKPASLSCNLNGISPAVSLLANNTSRTWFNTDSLALYVSICGSGCQLRKFDVQSLQKSVHRARSRSPDLEASTTIASRKPNKVGRSSAFHIFVARKAGAAVTFKSLRVQERSNIFYPDAVRSGLNANFQVWNRIQRGIVNTHIDAHRCREVIDVQGGKRSEASSAACKIRQKDVIAKGNEWETPKAGDDSARRELRLAPHYSTSLLHERTRDRGPAKHSTNGETGNGAEMKTSTKWGMKQWKERTEEDRRNGAGLRNEKRRGGMCGERKRNEKRNEQTRCVVTLLRASEQD
ncbi:hypothetical protein IMY05_C4467001000 [Salix suchowensis]|nr:hypothetical protein IMY05_C4467001000 [Salix suchowensis]